MRVKRRERSWKVVKGPQRSEVSVWQWKAVVNGTRWRWSSVTVFAIDRLSHLGPDSLILCLTPVTLFSGLFMSLSMAGRWAMAIDGDRGNWLRSQQRSSSSSFSCSQLSVVTLPPTLFMLLESFPFDYSLLIRIFFFFGYFSHFFKKNFV